VRDVFAVLGAAADAEVRATVNVDGVAWCTVSVAAGQFASTAVAGLGLGRLASGSKLTLSVLTVGGVYPGADLTVVVRL
jgi:hypothetical protein